MNKNSLLSSFSRNIILQLVKSEFKLRYQNSYLGYLWTLFKPLMLFGVIYLVFSNFLKSAIPNFPLYLLIGVIIWNYFQEATLIGLDSLISKRDLITKIDFPRATIIIASVLGSSLTFLLNLIIVFIFLILSNISLGLETLYLFWIIILLYFFITGIIFLLTRLYLRFFDLKHIWEVLLQMIFWLTPIVYDLSIVPENLQKFLQLNPLAHFINAVRMLFLSRQIPSLQGNLLLLFFATASFTIGYFVFQRQERFIAEKL